IGPRSERGQLSRAPQTLAIGQNNYDAITTLELLARDVETMRAHVACNCGPSERPLQVSRNVKQNNTISLRRRGQRQPNLYHFKLSFLLLIVSHHNQVVIEEPLQPSPEPLLLKSQLFDLHVACLELPAGRMLSAEVAMAVNGPGLTPGPELYPCPAEGFGPQEPQTLAVATHKTEGPVPSPGPVSPGKKRVRISDSTSVMMIENNRDANNARRDLDLDISNHGDSPRRGYDTPPKTNSPRARRGLTYDSSGNSGIRKKTGNPDHSGGSQEYEGSASVESSGGNDDQEYRGSTSREYDETITTVDNLTFPDIVPLPTLKRETETNVIPLHGKATGRTVKPEHFALVDCSGADLDPSSTATADSVRGHRILGPRARLATAQEFQAFQKRAIATCSPPSLFFTWLNTAVIPLSGFVRHVAIATSGSMTRNEPAE
ncbi:hypothetical protein BaRGS_00028928, partial [Batillaria attramentaria]